MEIITIWEFIKSNAWSIGFFAFIAGVILIVYFKEKKKKQAPEPKIETRQEQPQFQNSVYFEKDFEEDDELQMGSYEYLENLKAKAQQQLEEKTAKWNILAKKYKEMLKIDKALKNQIYVLREQIKDYEIKIRGLK